MVPTVAWEDGTVVMIDQRRLPLEVPAARHRVAEPVPGLEGVGDDAVPTGVQHGLQAGELLLEGVDAVVHLAGENVAGKGSGRKTILNYGSGSGGRGGGLSGRGRLAEPEPTASIVKQAAPAAEPKQAVTEVAVDGKGVGMTISGQIAGRKILQVVAPEYTAKARRNGGRERGIPSKRRGGASPRERASASLMSRQ